MPDHALIEQLDQAINILLSGGQPAGDPEMTALAGIAASLRDLPDEGFQKRLKFDLQRRANMTTSAVAPIREGFHTITPYITVPDGAELIEFLKSTFGAEELLRHQSPAGFHAEVRIGDSMLMIGSGESVRGHEKIGAFHVYVPDCDAVYDRAIEAGATSMGAPSDHHYGERAGYVKDSAGNHWYIATHLGPTPALESLWTVTPFVHPARVPKYIEFLERALGATKLALYEDSERVVYAAVRIGDAVLEMGEPHDAPASPRAGFYLYVDDCDAVYRRAIEAGATSLWPPTDQPYGDRTAGVMDPFGYQWFPATHIKDVR
ncbi:MAG: Glyoxalase/bleomycin resistance protein/dioxygenase [Bryobacterales bacterium]|jgi:PhnB protein|nr:Glyoxalase/bleomycin resistance protein/dioxygenase [Bryobacterales bacterium]